MDCSVLLLGDESESRVSEEFARELRSDGFQVIEYASVLPGESRLAQASALLESGGSVVLLATASTIGKRWTHLIVRAAHSRPQSQVIIVRLEEEAYVEQLAFDGVVAEHWQNAAHARQQVVEALRRHCKPPDSTAETDIIESSDLSNLHTQTISSYLASLVAEVEPIRPGRLHGLNVPIEIQLRDIFVPLRGERDRPNVDRRLTLEELARMRATLENVDDPNERERQLRVYAELESSVRDAGSVAGETELLDDIVDREPRVVLLGDPGSGKTTFLRHVALRFAERLLSAPETVLDAGADELLPVYVRVAEYAEARARTPDVAQYLAEHCAIRQSRLPIHQASALFTGLLDHGRIMVLLDGLDEVVDDDDRSRIVEAISLFAGTHVRMPPRDIASEKRLAGAADRTGRAAGNRLVVTSRIAGYRPFSELRGTFIHYRIAQLRRPDVVFFVTKWATAIESAVRRQTDAVHLLREPTVEARSVINAIDASSGVRNMAENPLLLRTLLMLHRSEGRLPDRRAKLYAAATRMLLHDWHLERGTQKGAAIDEGTALSLLGPLAMYIHETHPSGLISSGEAEDVLSLASARRAHDKPSVQLSDIDDATRATVRSFLKIVREHSGLFVERGTGLFGFMHLTFQEYFVARQIAARRGDSANQIVARLHQPRWREPLLLAIAVLSEQFYEDTSSIVRSIRDAVVPFEDVLHRNLLFAAECLAECDDVAPAQTQAIVEELVRLYIGHDGACRFASLRAEVRRLVSRLRANAAWSVDRGFAAVLAAPISRTSFSDLCELLEPFDLVDREVVAALASAEWSSMARSQRLLRRWRWGGDRAPSSVELLGWRGQSTDDVVRAGLFALWVGGCRRLVEEGLGVHVRVVGRACGDPTSQERLIVGELMAAASSLANSDPGPDLDRELVALIDRAVGTSIELSRGDRRWLFIVRLLEETRRRGSQSTDHRNPATELRRVINWVPSTSDITVDQLAAADISSILAEAIASHPSGTRITDSSWSEIRHELAEAREFFYRWPQLDHLWEIVDSLEVGTTPPTSEELTFARGEIARGYAWSSPSLSDSIGRRIVEDARFDGVAVTIASAIREHGPTPDMPEAIASCGRAIVRAGLETLRKTRSLREYTAWVTLLAGAGSPVSADLVDYLRADAADRDGVRRSLAVRALLEPRPRALLPQKQREAVLIGALASGDNESASDVLTGLLRPEPSTNVVAAVWSLASAPGHHLQGAAKEGLSRLRSIPGQHDLMTMLASSASSSDLRPWALSLLERATWHGSETAEIALGWLTGPDQDLRCIAAIQLVENDWFRRHMLARARLTRGASSRANKQAEAGPGIVIAPMPGLRDIGASSPDDGRDWLMQSVPALVDALTSSSDAIRWAADRLLHKLGSLMPDDGSSIVVQWLAGRTAPAGGAAFSTEGGFAATVIASTISQMRFTDRYWPSRWLEAIQADPLDKAASAGLQSIALPSPVVVAVLSAAIGSENRAVALAAIEAVANMRLHNARARRNAEATASLTRALRGATSPARASAAYALQWTSSAEARLVADELANAAQSDKESDVRAIATVSLGRLARHGTSSPALRRRINRAIRDLFSNVGSNRSMSAASLAVSAGLDALTTLDTVRPVMSPVEKVDAVVHGFAYPLSWSDTGGEDLQARVGAVTGDWLLTLDLETRALCVEALLGGLEQPSGSALDGDPRWAKDRMRLAVLAAVADGSTYRSFAPTRSLENVLEILATSAKSGESYSVRRLSLRILGDLQHMTPEVAECVFMGNEDIHGVAIEVSAAVPKFRYFAPGCFDALGRLLTARRRSSLAVLQAAQLLGQLGAARSDQLGGVQRDAIASTLYDLLTSPLPWRDLYVRDSRGEVRPLGHVDDVVFDGITRVVAGPDARLVEPAPAISIQTQAATQPPAVVTEVFASADQGPISHSNLVAGDPIGATYVLVVCAEAWVSSVFGILHDGYQVVVVEPTFGLIPHDSGSMLVTRDPDEVGGASPIEYPMGPRWAPGVSLLVAAPSSLVAGVNVVFTKGMLRVRFDEQSRALSSDEVVIAKSDNVNVSIPWWKGAVETIKYVWDGSELVLVYRFPNDRSGLRRGDIVITRGVDLPIFSDQEIGRARARKKRPMESVRISLPASEDGIRKVSYVRSSSRLTIVLEMSDIQPGVAVGRVKVVSTVDTRVEALP
jgi:hypothetical protein